ncbi:hypothetical protein ACOJBM_40930 [Rhizobium beringeri]
MPRDVDYLNAHGAGTKANDQIETTAIKRVFDDHARSMSISSTKSTHARTASGSKCARNDSLRDGDPREMSYRPPPTIASQTPVVIWTSRQMCPRRRVRVAMSNAFAMGGMNAVLAFKRVQ